MNKHSVIILIIVTLLLHAWPAWRHFSQFSREPYSTFRANPLSVVNEEKARPSMLKEFINPESVSDMVHVSSICELADGRLASVWYGGTREGSKDTAVFISIRDADSREPWSRPRVIIDRKSASEELKRYVKKVGNAVIFTDSEGRLWLVYVTIAIGGWSGSSLNVKMSNDGGDSWSTSERITLSPFFNVSELVKNNPVFFENGDFAIPIYHECFGRFPEMLWVRTGNNGSGISFRKTRMAGGRRLIQPSVVACDSYSGRAFYRNLASDRKVAFSTTDNAGSTWSEPENLRLRNPDSGINALLLSDGRILMAFNDSSNSRESLSLAISDDCGSSWENVSTIENEEGQEFSYPYMILGRNGTIHLVYTWKRRHIRHLAFNDAWIDIQKGVRK
ncbi:MAG: exo-alpha-sialidase [Deltaproteobacteria bacterium]|nr:exo-alpha-sialidase [Deltaproteobacteria bacterium]